MKQLAMEGGEPVRRTPWPDWPEATATTEVAIRGATRAPRWAISGFWTGTPALDQQFSEQFSTYLGTRFAVPCDHGSSALVMALEALGIGAGDEVIVPGLTWVACASAVQRVNAEPVLVDICPRTLCLDPPAVEAAVTRRTAAILVVHLYSAMAEMDALRRIADRHGLLILEDSAQAHGATWNGRKAGSLGEIGTFSFQQGKVMTCGEGGAAVTSDPTLAALLEQVRGDGRRYGPPTESGRMHLLETGGMQGRNYGLSEFQAAVLLDALSRLDDQNQLRAANADYLDAQLGSGAGLEPVEPYPQNDARAYYHYPLRLRLEAFPGRSVEWLGEALSAELGTWIHPPYAPLSRHPLLLAPPGRRFAGRSPELRSVPHGLPETERQVARTLLLHHSCLLGSRSDMDDIVNAVRKVREAL
jgi:dTDP-4-amino-4,6-dideoxygalactose transaminase